MINQTTIAVKNIDSAYTSASTALNQNESVTANVNAPTAPPTSAMIRCGGVHSSGWPSHCRVRRTMMRWVSSTVNALASTEIRLTDRATYSVGTNIEKSRPTSM